MNAFLDMLRDTFEFFVDVGMKVDVFGLNLWTLSLLVFAMACIVRFLFPLIFGASASLQGFTNLSRSADRYNDSSSVVTQSRMTEGQRNGYVSSTYYQQKGGISGIK